MGVKPFQKKPYCVKGRSVYVKQKNSSQRNIQYYNIHHTGFESALEIYLPRLCGKTKISDSNFFYQSWQRQL